MTEQQAKAILEKLNNYRYSSKECSMEIAQSLLSRYGLEVDENISYEYVNKKMLPDPPEVLVHNVNHFIMASPNRRLLPEFGLGSPKQGIMHSKEKCESLLPDKEATQEEGLVAALDAIYSFHFGYTLQMINFDSLDLEDIQNLF